MFALQAEAMVDRIHYVGSHHGDLVDDECEIVDREDVARRDLVLLAVKEQAIARQPEKGMQCLAADVEGGNAGRRADDPRIRR